MISDASWEWTKRAGTVSGLTGAAIGVAFFFFNQNQRIATLEAQMQAVTITTSVKGSGALVIPDKGSAKPGSGETYGSSEVVTVNPIAQACADLAKQLAAKSYLSGTDPIPSAMSAIGCSQIGEKK